MSDLISAVILAAGKGTRLKVSTPKPLCLCVESPLVEYVIDSLVDYDKSIDIGLVVGHEKEKVISFVQDKFKDLDCSFVEQVQQLGTGHAVQVYFESNPMALKSEYTLVVCADTPLLTPDIYERLVNEVKSNSLDAACASFICQAPKGYGRVIRTKQGVKIVEEKDATTEQKNVKEVNSGVYIFKSSYIKDHISKLSNNNKSGEFYLTDLIKEGQKVDAIVFEDESSFLGVNDLVQLDQARSTVQKRINEKHMRNGVRIINSSSVYISKDVLIEAEAVIYPNTSLVGNTVIKRGSIIEQGVFIKDSKVGEDVEIKAHSYIEKAVIENSCAVGPMARIRVGTHINSDCKIGNFVETKKSILDKGVKVSHLSYVGDAQIGENTNIGCGFITCNYDGANKHKTIIGKNSFIGSDCQMIAPVNIGDEAYVGSGSTINKNVPDGAFAIARQRQETKLDLAKKFIKKPKNS